MPKFTRPTASIQAQIALYVCGLTASFNDSTVTASDATGPIIVGSVHAYRELSGVDWSSDFEGYLKKPSHLMSISTHISNLRLNSTNTSLTLHEDSYYEEPEKLSIYTGSLNLSWTQKTSFFIHPLLPPISSGSVNKSSILTVSSLTLKFRLDNNNSMLDCYDRLNDDDSDKLICVKLTGTLENPMGGYSVVEIECKSNQPIQYPDPFVFNSRCAKITIC